MKKIKTVCILLALVIAMSCMASCGMFTDNLRGEVDKTIMRIGDEEINMYTYISLYGNIYNNLYNSLLQQYYYYIYTGQVTYEYLQQLVAQQAPQEAYDQIKSMYTVIAKHVKDAKSDTSLVFDNTLSSQFKYAKYISQSEADYCLKATKYTIINSMLATIESEIGADYSLATEKAEDNTVREKETPNVVTSYSDNYYKLDTEKVDELLFKYTTDTSQAYDLNSQNFASALTSLSLDSTQLKTLLDQYNERINGEPMTANTLMGYINSAYNALVLKARKEYDLSVGEYIDYMLGDMIVSCLISRIERENSKKLIESDQAELLANLEQFWNGMKKDTQESYIIDAENYDKFMGALFSLMNGTLTDEEKEALGDSVMLYPYVLSIPSGAESRYVYVKNLLVPFNTAQTAELKALLTAIGTTDKTEYKAFRQSLATQILAEHFTDQDKPLESFFSTSGDEITVIPTSTLATRLSAIENGDDFLQLMFEYNTDTAQHSSFYDYIVNVKPDATYDSSWVDEFQQGAEDLYEKWSNDPDNADKYTTVVTDYGVHVIYLNQIVEEQSIDFTSITKFYTTDTLEYKLLSDYYTRASSSLFEDLFTTAAQDNETVWTKYFQDWLESRALTINK